MKLIDVYRKIKALDVPVFQTRDVAACLKISNPHASKILTRLAAAAQIVKLAQGYWGLEDKLDVLQLPQLLTAPYPSYVSLQTALYYQGIISQIPSVIYAVSLSRTRRYNTPLGTVSTHYIQPEFFCGYHTDAKTGIKMASPEKAIIDLLYLHPSKSRLFANLPEVEFPNNFDITCARGFIAKIPSLRRRKMVATLFASLLENITN